MEDEGNGNWKDFGSRLTNQPISVDPAFSPGKTGRGRKETERRQDG